MKWVVAGIVFGVGAVAGFFAPTIRRELQWRKVRREVERLEHAKRMAGRSC